MAKHLKVITQSSARTYRACPKRYKFANVECVRPRVSSEALEFGNAWHLAREAWWKGIHTTSILENALNAHKEMFKYVSNDSSQSESEETTLAKQFAFSRLSAMLVGYHARWFDYVKTLKILGVEQQFSVPVVSPESGRTSKIWEAQGKLDALVEENSELWVVEEKTASGDLGPDSPYWRRLEIDPQSSMYFDAVERGTGMKPAGIMYFVNVKPSIRPFRKSKNLKLKEDGTPYANQHDHDETPKEFYDRLLDAYQQAPEKYFHMVKVPRLAKDIWDSQADIWNTTKAIRQSELTGIWPRNPDACIHPFGSSCPYLSVCANRASIDDPMLFERLTTPHPELDPT
jgi:PD-(D/E)XK nuclease superfamily protein